MVCIGLTLLLLTITVASKLVELTGIHIDIYLVAVGCVSGLITGLIYGVSRGQLEIHASIKPNQGLWRSLYNGGRVLLIVGLIVWIVYDIPVLVSYRLAVNQAPPRVTINFPSNQILTGVLIGISIGFFFGLLNGGIACIKHVLLRVFLWRARGLPWNSARFLNYATERILLRKVGGGYIFVHRLLLEYFAALVTPFLEEASAVTVVSDVPPVLSSTSQIDIAQREEKAPPIPSRKTGFNKEKRIAALFVVVLLLEFSCGLGIFGVVQRAVQNTNDAVATAQARAYDVAATVTAQAQATAQAPANATAEALTNASPVAYPPQNTSPVLNDPLQDNSKGYRWEVDDPKDGKCTFINRAYDINTHNLEQCFARSTDFTNFIYEIQMKIVKGDGGGIAFRAVSTENQYYYFVINRNGSYYIYDSYDTFPLTQGSSPAIHQRLNQTNLVAAVVRGNIIELYVNHKRVAVVGSGISTHGQIGVIVEGSQNQTEVIFQNAKVWRL